MNYETLYAFSLATTALAITPGPDNIYVLTQSVTNGLKHGLATTAGLISGCLVHTTLLAIGVSALLKENDSMFLTIKWLGALYLFYLAFQVFKGDSSILLFKGGVPKKTLSRLFKQGFVMNVLNPKVTIFFLAFFPSFLFSDTLSTMVQFYVLGLLFMILSFGVFCSIVLLSGAISNYLKSNTYVGVFLKWAQVFVLICIGVYILLSDK
ncbi:MAG: LysE family translocator [Flavobacteriaceae bacterium]